MRWIEHQATEGMLSSAPEMNVRLPNTRSQDDATVGYFFQRPQTDQDFQNYSKQTRWAVGDDSVLEVRHSNDTEYDNELQALGREVNHQGLEDPSSFGRFGVRNGSLSLANDGYQRSQQEALPQLAPSTKKLWSDDSKGGIFLDDQWRGWGASEHAVSQPMMVQRRGPGGDIGTVLSPRSSDTGGLGVKMVEYVLASSPTGSGLESRMARLAMDDKTKLDIKKEQDPLPQQNGVVQNGLDDDKGFNRQPSPAHNDLVNNHADMNKLTKEEMVNAHHMMAMNQAHMGFESQMDPLGFEYNSQLMTSVDSPSVMDYNGQMFPRQQQQQQQQQMMMAQQQFAMAQQQQQQMGMAPGGFPSNPYVLNPQDPCAQVGPMMTAGPMMPPYYGMPPWGMYPQAGNMIQQQQQLMRENIGRPNTPQQQNIDPLGSVQQPNGNQYSMMTPQFYDQNNPMLLGNNRGMATPMRLMPSGPMMMNGANQGTMNSNPLRLLGSQSSLYSNPGPSTPQSSLFNSSQSSSGLGFNPTGLSGSTTNGFGLQNGYGSSSLGTLGSSTFGAMGLAASTQRRGSLERRDVTGLSSNLELSRQIKTPYYGALGSIGSGQGSLGSLIPGQGGLEVLSSPGQSLTPPPSSSLSLGGLMSGSRVISAAPGAEAKFRNGSAANGIFGNSSLLSRQSTGLDKPSNRSRLLEDFRNNRYPNLQLRDLSNHIVEFSQDQHGSRFIQQKLERATLPEKQLVFNEILTAAYSLMMDVFGNYVIQKFFEFGTPEQKQMLAQRVRGHVLPLALQMYGCRVIQKALDSIPMDQQKDLVKELDGHVLKCVKDQNGNHVVQKCIETVDPSALQFIINSFQGQVFTLSTHPYGCRVIQRILEHCTAEQTASILEELHQNVEQLVQDQYGNYVIQHVLERGRPEDKSRIVTMISGKVLPLAQHKFASNVVEKCVTHATRSERAVLIEEVCTVMDGPNSALYLMMKDQFANYVIQKMLDMAEPAQRKILMHKIKPHVATLKKFTYGKHILAKLEKFFMKVDINGGM